jgi:hypothetical protein
MSTACCQWRCVYMLQEKYQSLFRSTNCTSFPTWTPRAS